MAAPITLYIVVLQIYGLFALFIPSPGRTRTTSIRSSSGDTNEQIIPPSPIIFSRQELFGSGDREAIASAAEESDGMRFTTSTAIPKGVERVEPSQIIKKPSQKYGVHTNNEEGDDDDDDYDDEDDSDVEIVDTFRFRIDAESLRNAIQKQSELKVRQQLSPASSSGEKVTTSDRDIRFDSSLLEKLKSMGTVDESGDNTVLRLELDAEEFAKLVKGDDEEEEEYELINLGDEDEEYEDGYEDEGEDGDEDDEDEVPLYSSDASYRKNRHSDERSREYSEMLMEEAEEKVARNIPRDSNRRGEKRQRKIARPDPKEIADNIRKNLSFKRIVSGISNIIKSCHNWLFGRESSQRLVDVSGPALSESLYGTAVIGITFAAAVLFFDELSALIISRLGRALLWVIDAIPVLRSRKEWIQKSSKPLLFLSICGVQLIRLAIERYKEYHRFQGIGYRVVEPP